LRRPSRWKEVEISESVEEAKKVIRIIFYRHEAAIAQSQAIKIYESVYFG
jgi:hypothetical protein